MTTRRIITIHGIWKTDLVPWQKKFKKWTKQDNGVEVYNYRYGILPATIAYLFGFTEKLGLSFGVRKYYVKKLIRYLHKISKGSEYPVSVVAHSFGAWLLGEAIRQDDSLHFNNIVLLHTPLSDDFEKTPYAMLFKPHRKVNKIYAWSSKNDLLIWAFGLPPFGNQGYVGFRKQDINDDLTIYDVYNEYTEEHHDGVIMNEKYYGRILAQCI